MVDAVVAPAHYDVQVRAAAPPLLVHLGRQEALELVHLQAVQVDLVVGPVGVQLAEDVLGGLLVELVGPGRGPFGVVGQLLRAPAVAGLVRFLGRAGQISSFFVALVRFCAQTRKVSLHGVVIVASTVANACFRTALSVL